MPELYQPTPASKLPLGILDLFGIKSLGRYPNILRGDIQPTLELLNLMASIHAEETFSGNPNVNALNFVQTGTLAVPQDQVWYLAEATWRALTPAAATIEFRGAALTTGNNGGIPIVFTGANILAASERLHVGKAAGSTNFLPPGTLIGVAVDAFTGANIVIDCFIRFLRFRF